MSELIVLCSVVGVLVLVAVLFPFLVGDGGFLQDASTSDSVQDLELKLNALLQRWVKDEAAFLTGEITQTEWRQRQRYLTSRYVDASRRLDWLNDTKKVETLR